MLIEHIKINYFYFSNHEINSKMSRVIDLYLVGSFSFMVNFYDDKVL